MERAGNTARVWPAPVGVLPCLGRAAEGDTGQHRAPASTEGLRMFWSPDQVPGATRAGGGGSSGPSRLRKSRGGRRAAGRRTLPCSLVPQAGNNPTIPGHTGQWNVGHPYEGTLLRRERGLGRPRGLEHGPQGHRDAQGQKQTQKATERVGNRGSHGGGTWIGCCGLEGGQ